MAAIFTQLRSLFLCLNAALSPVWTGGSAVITFVLYLLQLSFSCWYPTIQLHSLSSFCVSAAGLRSFSHVWPPAVSLKASPWVRVSPSRCGTIFFLCGLKKLFMNQENLKPQHEFPSFWLQASHRSRLNVSLDCCEVSLCGGRNSGWKSHSSCLCLNLFMKSDSS